MCGTSKMLQQNIYSLIPVLILAVLPSLIWLFFYLKEDLHPEPKYWLFIIFIMGVALAPLVIFLEMALNKWGSGALIFIIAPLVEETAKYGVVQDRKSTRLNSSHSQISY